MLQPRTLKIKLLSVVKDIVGMNLSFLLILISYYPSLCSNDSQKYTRERPMAESCQRNLWPIDSQSISSLPTSKKVGQVLEINWSQK